jgi:iron complex transport system ATP-binding protein
MPTSHASDTLLAVRHLKIRRNTTHILRGVDWTVRPGQHWAILGANGCGKTSLLSAITGYLMPSSGEISLLGNVYGRADWSEVRQQIGIVSSALAHRVPKDETALETVLSGDTGQLGFWTREETVDTHKALHCLDKLGVRALADRQWQILSQGERQKVFIARALMADPSLLILDEPCAGMDPVARESFLGSLRLLAQGEDPTGLILVTHHVEEIFPEITHVLLLRKGKVLQSGAKADVLKSEFLSEAFGAEVKVRCNRHGRWSLSFEDVDD